MKGDEPVSMNLLGFTPAIMPVLTEAFSAFEAGGGIDAGEELFLPNVVGQHLGPPAGLDVTVLVSDDRCLGVTHPDDVPLLQETLRRPGLVSTGHSRAASFAGAVPPRPSWWSSSTGRPRRGGRPASALSSWSSLAVVGVVAVVAVVGRRGRRRSSWSSSASASSWSSASSLSWSSACVVVVVVVGFVVAVVDVAGLAVVAVVDGRGRRRHRRRQGELGEAGLRVAVDGLNSPPTKTWSPPTATEYGPVGVSALGFQGSTSAGGGVEGGEMAALRAVGAVLVAGRVLRDDEVVVPDQEDGRVRRGHAHGVAVDAGGPQRLGRLAGPEGVDRPPGPPVAAKTVVPSPGHTVRSNTGRSTVHCCARAAPVTGSRTTIPLRPPRSRKLPAT